MNNEIKHGDKVRVSKDIPQFYRRYNSYRVFEVEHQVVDIEDGIALLDSIPSKYVTTIPIKYLVKVDAEAKETNVKIGDKVIVHYPSGDRIGHIKEAMWDGTYDIDYGDGCTGHNITRSQIEPYTARKIKVGDAFKSDSINGTVKYVDGNCVGVLTDDGWNIEVSLYDMKEQTEAEKNANEELQEEFARFMSGRMPILSADRIEREHIQRRMRIISQDDFLKEINPAEHEVNSKPRYVPKIMFNTEFWVKYEADLAKEVALKVANKKMDNHPEEIGAYAVSVAKAVVEGLKRTLPQERGSHDND